MSEFKGKVVVITGGNGGIGKEVARRFVGFGSKVYILGRNEETLKEVAAELMGGEGEGEGEINWKIADVSDVEACRKTIEEIGAEAGQIDVLVNSAGKYVETTIEEIEQKDFDESFNINVRGTYFMCKFAKPYLEKTKGCIVNVGSTAGIVGFDENSLYCATKGALNAFTRAVAIEYAKYGIRVNIVCPDMVKTKMLDIGFKRSGMESREDYNNFRLKQYPQADEDKRFVLPEEVAECVVFLASNEKVWAITGTALTIDLGMTAGFF